MPQLSDRRIATQEHVIRDAPRWRGPRTSAPAAELGPGHARAAHAEDTAQSVIRKHICARGSAPRRRTVACTAFVTTIYSGRSEPDRETILTPSPSRSFADLASQRPALGLTRGIGTLPAGHRQGTDRYMSLVMGRSCIARYLLQRPDDGDQDQRPPATTRDGGASRGSISRPCGHAIAGNLTPNRIATAPTSSMNTPPMSVWRVLAPILRMTRRIGVPRHLHGTRPAPAAAGTGGRRCAGPASGRFRSASVMLSRGCVLCTAESAEVPDRAALPYHPRRRPWRHIRRCAWRPRLWIARRQEAAFVRDIAGRCGSGRNIAGSATVRRRRDSQMRRRRARSQSGRHPRGPPIRRNRPGRKVVRQTFSVDAGSQPATT